MTHPLLPFLTQWVVLLIGHLRRRYERFIAPVIQNPGGCPQADVRRMLIELVRGEARLRREIHLGAMRELGLACARRRLADYAPPPPRSTAALRARLVDYRNMLADPERCVRRLVARLRLSPLHSARGTIRVTIFDVASILLELLGPRAVARTHPAIHPP